MSTKVRKHTDVKKQIRFKRKARIRGRLAGTAERPRISIFRSNAQMYAQMIDDNSGKTIVSASSLEKANKGKVKNSVEGAKAIGKLLATRAQEKKINTAVFDRSGYIYHGRIKALAEAAREAGLKF